MRASDYIADFLAEHGIRHCYGYQGTMIAFFVDAVCRDPRLFNHVCYNEQGAAFAAVGEAKITGRPTLAYATSGPGAANLISGIADAYYDSAPVIFITGQLNTYEYQNIPGLKQHGFQEMNIVDMVSPVVKYARQVKTTEELPDILEKAYHAAVSGRPGPVLIDLPMNIQREEINTDKISVSAGESSEVPYDDLCEIADLIIHSISEAERPVLLLGNGVVNQDRGALRDMISKLGLPVVTSLPGRDILPEDHPLNFGYLGYAYGHRYANIIINKKTDLIISLGCNLNHRQTGMKTEIFAEKARIIRVDIDLAELQRKVHKDDICCYADCKDIIRVVSEKLDAAPLSGKEKKYRKLKTWLEICSGIKSLLMVYDQSDPLRQPNSLVSMISDKTENAGAIICDVGQHQMWGAQSYKLRGHQRMIFSGGHGAMGFSLPAAIGAHYACGKPVITITGDGSLQMNIQELQWIHREKIPVTVFVMNNRALGLIHQQQDALFQSRYFSSVKEGGYLVPDFCRVADAYGINSYKAPDGEMLENILEHIDLNVPNLVEIILPEDSCAAPKTSFGEAMHNQSPFIPENIMNHILAL